MSEDRCVICGEIVPEGRMVCPDCEKRPMKNLSHGEMVQIAEGRRKPMPRYIDADYLLREISFYADRPTKAAMKTIKEIARHPANVVERKKGKWIIDGHHINCNQCGMYMCNTDREGDKFPINFCPNCGAEMEEPDEIY